MGFVMDDFFSDRISDVPRSFIREILKVTSESNIISFAGGLPNRMLFPVEELKASTMKVFEKSGADSLQYSNSEGYKGLRKFISDRYLSGKGLSVDPENILITTGSQQGLDLLGKVFLNEGDDIIIEEPGYLGAIQAFSVYRAGFNPVKLHNYGLDLDELGAVLDRKQPKLMYTVPNFQNPSGISYSVDNRRSVSSLLKGKRIFLIEDDPYGELLFSGEPKPSFKTFLPDNTIMLGSFSKTVVPSFRLGWIVAPAEILDKILIAKQASDLHTNYFCQRIVYEYLTDYDINEHIKKIVAVYRRQRDAMIESIRKYFSPDVMFTEPDGGMFLWVTLPAGMSSMKLFDIAIKKGVAFVPGNPFYTDDKGERNTLRLNFSCSDEKTIVEGIRRLANSIDELREKK